MLPGRGNNNGSASQTQPVLCGDLGAGCGAGGSAPDKPQLRGLLRHLSCFPPLQPRAKSSWAGRDRDFPRGKKKISASSGGRFAACGGLRARGRRGAPGEDTGSPWGGCGRPGAPCPREVEGIGIPPTDRWDLKVPLKVKIKMLFG